jgi:hypothetical protein
MIKRLIKENLSIQDYKIFYNVLSNNNFEELIDNLRSYFTMYELSNMRRVLKDLSKIL